MGTVEQWRYVEGYRNYLVSNLGRVMSLKYSVPKILSLKTGEGYYPKVVLCENGMKTTVRVHQLVAEAFLPNPKKYEYVDHIDGNRENNCAENLRWCSPKENSNNPITYRRMVKAMHDYWNENRMGYKARFKVILPGEAVS